MICYKDWLAVGPDSRVVLHTGATGQAMATPVTSLIDSPAGRKSIMKHIGGRIIAIYRPRAQA